MGLGQLPYLGFITVGQAQAAESPPASVAQGAFIGSVRANRTIVTPGATYRNTIIEPYQTDKETKT